MPNIPPAQLRVLVLGGTTEASGLADLLAHDARFDARLSLAGRTANPKIAALPTRTGGFGGADGLLRHIETERVAAVVDATHPFAAQMSRHAIEACRRAGCPLITIERPPWQPMPGDRWHKAADIPAAVAALGTAHRRVLSAIGRQNLDALEAAPQHHYLIRVIDPPHAAPCLPSFSMMAARGPFSTADDIALLARERIDVVLAKNAGGEAAISKVIAARTLGIPIVMVGRPTIPARDTVETPEAALAWLIARHDATAVRGE